MRLSFVLAGLAAMGLVACGGGGDSSGGTETQTPSDGRSSVSISAAVSRLPVSAGGIETDGSLAVTRAINSLSPGLPGTNACWPLASFAVAPALSSRRKPDLRAASSAPWH